MSETTETDYVHPGARALVRLHERHLRSFVATWKRAAEARLEMPPTEDPDCASLDALLAHVLGCARHYMVWLCGVLELDDPGIEAVPDGLGVDAQEGIDPYLEHVLERWDGPLRGVDGRRLDRGVHRSGWGVEYCCDAMLEHAVMHAVRHEFQLERILG